ncbi:MAG: signal peptidase I [Oscillospiraceae bacterium]|nr:signal peptidase I [Oscillospiraceae bacterium]
MDNAEKKSVKRQKFSLCREIFDWSQALLQAVIAIVLVFAFVASMYSVEGRSMQNTLHQDQMLMISNLFYTPKQGDIVMFTEFGIQRGFDERTGKYSPFVKRVIGLPGDVVELDPEKGVLINGEGLDEPYLPENMNIYSYQRFPEDDGEVIPEGKIFVMGDNRNYSMDSRDPAVGLVDMGFLLGRVIWRVSPFSDFGPV